MRRGDGLQGGGMNEIRHTYHGQLDDLRVDVVRLGLMATDAIAAGTDAFLEADLTRAEQVIHADQAIDDLTHSLEERCYTTLARQQPMASDLRMVVAVLRTIHETERTGDLMVNVAKTTRRLYPVELPDPIPQITDHRARRAATQMAATTTVSGAAPEVLRTVAVHPDPPGSPPGSSGAETTTAMRSSPPLLASGSGRTPPPSATLPAGHRASPEADCRPGTG